MAIHVMFLLTIAFLIFIVVPIALALTLNDNHAPHHAVTGVRQ
jgi:hypothetical protein